jgi:hypothetical protein
MLFKFKSKVTGDLIMLEPDAKRLLKIMGREEQVKGIFFGRSNCLQPLRRLSRQWHKKKLRASMIQSKLACVSAVFPC